MREKPTLNNALSPISCLHCRGACQRLSKRPNKTKRRNRNEKTTAGRQLKTSLKLDLDLFVKVHEENNLVLDGGEEVVFVDELVNVLVPQSQVDFQSSVVPLVVRVPAEATSADESPCLPPAPRYNYRRYRLQFSQGGEQSPVGLILLQVVVDGLNDRHVIVKVSRPLTDQRRETLLRRSAASGQSVSGRPTERRGGMT